MENYLIFSDTHFKKTANKNLVRSLQELILKFQNVIILGDFWDKYFTTFEEFISNTAYQELFEALKSRNTIYIYGNHDPKEMMDERVNLFCNTCVKSFSLELPNKTLYFEHGDDLAGVYPTQGILKFIDEFRTNFLKINDKHVAFIDGIAFSLFERFTNGRNLFGDRWNQIILRKSGIGKYKNKILICGHTHYYCRYDNYINTGANMYGFLQYMKIENNSITQVQTKYQRTLTYPF